MSKVSTPKLLIQIALVVVGAMAGGSVGRHTVDQSEMFFAAALFFGTLGGLLGLVVAWTLFRGSKS
jgi:hypothetical protein